MHNALEGNWGNIEFFMMFQQDQLGGKPQAMGDFDLMTVVTRPPWNQNCYVLRHRDSGAIGVIDPGGDLDKILAAVNLLQEGDEKAPVEILLTHGHPDHIGALVDLADSLKAPYRAHLSEAEVIKASPKISAALMGIPMEPPEDCLYFNDGESRPLAGVGSDWRSIFTPGHTPGGVCYAFNGMVFTGDTLFCRGFGRTDLPGGDSVALMTSIKVLLDQIPGDSLLFSGHGPAWKASDAKKWWFNVSRQF